MHLCLLVPVSAEKPGGQVAEPLLCLQLISLDVLTLQVLRSVTDVPSI